MFCKVVRRVAMLIGCGLVILITAVGDVQAGAARHQLANGMELIMVENHSSSMVASIIYVRSGSKYETRFENGITHFLEHLLFDGTVHQSREQLDEGIRNLGGYINAFTREDQTAYLVLMPRQHIKYALTVQADMLFNSTFPEGELAKERQVVIEEIRRDRDDPDYAPRSFLVEKALGGTDYAQPVLGYEAFIENIPREAIIDYWKRYYKPERMTVLLIGDFQVDSMKAVAEAVFGPIPGRAVGLTGDSAGIERPSSDSVDSSGIQYVSDPVIKSFDTLAQVTSTYIDFSIPCPGPLDSGYLPLDLLSQYLAMDGVSPLKEALLGGESPLATECTIGLVPYEGFSRLEIAVRTDRMELADSIVTVAQAVLGTMPTYQADAETFEGIKTSLRCEEIYNAERLHYYGFMVAPLMMTAGWDFIETYADRIVDVSWDQCRQAAVTWLAKPRGVATIVKPATTESAAFVPTTMSAEEVTAHFSEAQIPTHDLTEGVPLTFPSADSATLTYDDSAERYTEEFENGLQLIIKSGPDSRVFAMTVLGRNRSAREPEGKEGITDFVNRCLEKGTATRSEEELSRDLAKIGARVSLYDNPWIPFDDGYTTGRFSFAKFETIDDYANKGYHLFAELILSPAFDSTSVETVRRSMLAMLQRQASAPTTVADQLFLPTLFDPQPFTRPVSGTTASIAGIMREDLFTHHRQFYSPANLIVSIATNKPIAEVRRWVEATFGRLASDSLLRLPERTPPSLSEIRQAHVDLSSDQVAIFLGSPLPGISDPDVPAIKAATAILSERLFGNLREKQGLAYSVGATSEFDRDLGWTYCSIGTGSDNYQKAVDGMILEIEKLKLDGPTPRELGVIRNQILGRMSSARLSRINQAYYAAVDLFLGLGPEYDSTYLAALSQVSVDAIRRAATRWFRTDAYVLVSAGTK
jgi:zinc protease